MAKECSFDIVSKVDTQVLKDAVNVAEKTIKGRYDLNKGDNKLELDAKCETITFIAGSDMAMNALKEIIVNCCIKKEISTKAFEFSEKETAFGGNIRMTAKVKQGIDKENASKITKIIKDGGFKVKTQIQDEQIRVTSKDIDSLQEVIAALRAADSINIALQFTNYR